MHWKTDNLMPDNADNDDSDVNMDTSDDSNDDDDDDDESLTNESTSDSNDNIIPIIKESKALASISAGRPLPQQNNKKDDSINLDADKVVKAILDAEKLHRNHPPSIILEDMITDICFHPKMDTIGIASVTGDVFM